MNKCVGRKVNYTVSYIRINPDGSFKCIESGFRHHGEALDFYYSMLFQSNVIACKFWVHVPGGKVMINGRDK